MLSKDNLKIVNFAEEEGKGREELTGLYISPKETCATDGFILTRVQAPRFDKSEIPEFEGKKANLDFKPFILPKEEAEKLLKIFPKSANFPILEHIFLLKQTPDQVEFGLTDLDSLNIVKCKTIEGEFPDYKPILERKGRHIKILLNIDFLYKISKFLKEFVDNPLRAVELQIPVEKDKPVHFLAEKKDGKKAQIVLMPIKED